MDTEQKLFRYGNWKNIMKIESINDVKEDLVFLRVIIMRLGIISCIP